MFRSITHLVLHVLVPGLIARYAFARNWKMTWFIMVAVMIVDLDHFLSNPVYDPGRCSIGFHLLHSYPAIGVYVGLTVIARTRVAGIGLLIHMALDGIDCFWMSL